MVCRQSRFYGDNCQYGNKLALLLQLEIEYDDGSTQTICSDEKFVTSDGPLVYSDIFIGERYDARLEKPGWSMPNYEDTGWKPVQKLTMDLIIYTLSTENRSKW